MKKRLIELLSTCVCEGPEEIGSCPSRKFGKCGEVEKLSYCAIQKIADHLIANGVTIQPAVPGPEMGYDMAERCYRNGEEAMREKVINYLRDQKGITMGVIRSTLSDVIEKVRKL